jgi:hypothetical protein
MWSVKLYLTQIKDYSPAEIQVIKSEPVPLSVLTFGGGGGSPSSSHKRLPLRRVEFGSYPEELSHERTTAWSYLAGGYGLLGL